VLQLRLERHEARAWEQVEIVRAQKGFLLLNEACQRLQQSLGHWSPLELRQEWILANEQEDGMNAFKKKKQLLIAFSALRIKLFASSLFNQSNTPQGR
jgi:hypothetical protein